jgi:hypothetical protein
MFGVLSALAVAEYIVRAVALDSANRPPATCWAGVFGLPVAVDPTLPAPEPSHYPKLSLLVARDRRLGGHPVSGEIENFDQPKEVYAFDSESSAYIGHFAVCSCL